MGGYDYFLKSKSHEGAELKSSYFKQAVRNLESALKENNEKVEQVDLFSVLEAA